MVDDSAFMRRAISNMLGSDAGIEVVGTASNGRIAIEKIKALKPDIVTMDIEMPVLDGISALKIIMVECPANVIVISSLTQAGSQAALDALAAGAADVLAKDHSTVSDTIMDLRDDLVAKARSIARRDPTRRRPSLRRLDSHHAPQAGGPSAASGGASPGADRHDPEMSIGGTIRIGSRRFRATPVDLVCIGSSTGGPGVVEEIIRALPRDLRVPVVVAQHMPYMFTKSMSERFDTLATVPVIHAQDRMPIEPGRVYIAPGGSHLQLVRRAGKILASVGPGPEGFIYRPSVDVLFASAAELPGITCLGVVLTGMGSDGADGAEKLARLGSPIIAQDQDTSVVYGMPKAVVERGIASAVMPPAAIAAAVAQAAGPIGAAHDSRRAG